MKTAFRWLKPILCFAMLPLLVSCVGYIPNESTVQNMSVKQARKVVVATQWRGDGSARVTSDKLIVTDKSSQTIYRFSELSDIRVWGDSTQDGYTYVSSGKTEFWIRLRDADAFASALYVLKRNAIKQEKDVAESDANFAASLTDYRKKAASNAALPEEANRYKVQAEGAVRDKEFDDAADLYAEALKIAPWWPAGHFNRALVLSETGEYGEAMREMKYYLQLLPDAPNARAAQDKIYEWERLESK